MVWDARTLDDGVSFAHQAVVARQVDVIVVDGDPFEASVPLGDWQLARAFARRGRSCLWTPFGVWWVGDARAFQVRRPRCRKSGLSAPSHPSVFTGGYVAR